MKALNNFIIFCIIIMVSSCDDIIEKDISKRRISIISPSENFHSLKYNVLFWWNEVEGTQSYRLQIVSPSFENIQKLVFDSLVTNTRIDITLAPGAYQWRIRGENGSSQTEYLIQNLTVDTIVDFTDQEFTVDMPTNNYAINNTTITFSWQKFPLADEYELLINNGTTETYTLSETFFTTILPEGSYTWKVRAINTQNNTKTLFSGERNLLIDQTPPLPSTPQIPVNYSLDSNSVTLQWLRDQGVASDSIIIANDSNFQNISYKLYTQDTFYNLPPLPVNSTYFWKLKSRDVASNWSGYSSSYRFTVIF